jgi:hypothetical protein
MFRPTMKIFIPLLLLALLLVSCTADSESYTAPRINPDEALIEAPSAPVKEAAIDPYTAPQINPDEALDFVPSAGIRWPSSIDSDFYTDPRINPDEALGSD